MDVVLPNGKTLCLACEFSRMDGWRITDTATGFLAQNKYLPNKTELNKYIKDENFLKALERITSQESYKNAEIELNNYKILYG